MYRETEGVNLLVWIVLAFLAVPASIIGAIVFAGGVYLICMKELGKAAISWLLSFGSTRDAFN